MWKKPFIQYTLDYSLTHCHFTIISIYIDIHHTLVVIETLTAFLRDSVVSAPMAALDILIDSLS